MKRLVVPTLALLGLYALAGCGGNGSGSAASSSATAAAPASTGGVAATSQYDGGPRAADTPIDESKVEVGKGLFQTKGCSACHAFGRRLSCPDLAGVTHRRTAAWMEQQILHPDVMTKTDPISHGLFATYALQMPNQGLTPDQARAVIEFFKHTDHEAGESTSK
jgi:mono/diheme cytochrome c family protein